MDWFSIRERFKSSVNVYTKNLIPRTLDYLKSLRSLLKELLMILIALLMITYGYSVMEKQHYTGQPWTAEVEQVRGDLRGEIQDNRNALNALTNEMNNNRSRITNEERFGENLEHELSLSHNQIMSLQKQAETSLSVALTTDKDVSKLHNEFEGLQTYMYRVMASQDSSSALIISQLLETNRLLMKQNAACTNR